MSQDLFELVTRPLRRNQSLSGTQISDRTSLWTLVVHERDVDRCPNGGPHIYIYIEEFGMHVVSTRISKIPKL